MTEYTTGLSPTTGWTHTGMMVQVKAAAEILRTLHDTSSQQGLPFMAEMHRYCGRHFRVRHCVNRLMVEGVGVRGIDHVIILEGVRCGGDAHGGCQRKCHLLWKEEWLAPSTETTPSLLPSDDQISMALPQDRSTPLPACQGQAPALMSATYPLSNFNLRQYRLELKTGSNSLRGILRIFGTMVATRIAWRLLMLKQRLPRKQRPAILPSDQASLSPGDLVEVRPKHEILATLDAQGKLHGLLFAELMWRYCGKRFRVLTRVDRMVVEESGQLRNITHTVMLEGVICDGIAFRGCPRTCYWMWKEAWLSRVSDIGE